MTYESKMANIIQRLKEVRQANPKYTIQKISEHTGVSASTVQRIFADGSEHQNFQQESIEPIAKMLLGLDSLDEGDDYEKALKAIIKLKDVEIENYKAQLEIQKAKFQEQLEVERAQYRKNLDFLENQIEKKDGRIDRLFDRAEKLGILYDELNQKYLKLLEKSEE